MLRLTASATGSARLRTLKERVQAQRTLPNVSDSSAIAITPVEFLFSAAFSLCLKRKSGTEKRSSSILQDGPLRPAMCPDLMIRGRLPHRSRAHRTGGSLSHARPRPYPQPKTLKFPGVVDKGVDNVDNFPGSGVDKWPPGGAKAKSRQMGVFGGGLVPRVDRGRALGYNDTSRRSCRTRGKERQNGT